MENLWLKFKIWTKIGLLSVLVIYLLLFVFKNSDQELTIWWWFGRVFQTSALELILISLLAGVIVTFAVRMAVRAIGQIRQLRDRNAAMRMQRDMSEIKAKADMLQVKPVVPVSLEDGTHP
jgi:uncharacterized integral membrane protein